MKIVSNNLQPITDEWSDPGDYPSLVGGPLPNYSYTSEINGEIVIEMDAKELAENHNFKNHDKARALADAAIPKEITVTDWDITQKGNQLILMVCDFEGNWPDDS